MSDLTRIKHQSRGTRIVGGVDAVRFWETIDTLRHMANAHGAEPVLLPAIDGEDGYSGSPGEMMRVVGPSAPTVLCPERTSQIRRLAEVDPTPRVVWYCERCYRLERPQANRYREFTQFGIEWIGGDIPFTLVVNAAIGCCKRIGIEKISVVEGVRRGLHYYRGDETFEIEVAGLGAQKQICGGGRYAEGIGFAFGVERLIAAHQSEQESR